MILDLGNKLVELEVDMILDLGNKLVESQQQQV
jgi:hypothetical protein